jgi:RNA polymerase sigma-54 factor
MLRQTQSQKLLQKTLPQIIQKQSLLAIPILSIEQMVRQEMEQNPFLEEIDDLADEQEVEEKETTEEHEKETEEVEKKEEEFDMDDFANSEIDGYKTEDYETSQKSVNYENIWKSKSSLTDSLMSQLHLSGLSEKYVFIGEIIIGNLDDEGYLRETNDEVLADIEKHKVNTEFEDENFELREIRSVVSEIQTFDPIGIASRNLRDCLLKQIDQLNNNEDIKSLAKKVLIEYFEEFRLKNYEKLMKELNVDIEVVNRIFELISKLNPKPGYIGDSTDSHYIYPDLIVRKENNEYKIEINDRNVPVLRLSKAYRDLTDNIGRKFDKSAKEFVKNNFERAKWFIDAIKSRRQTMLKVMNSILKRQREFFDNMGENLKPMYEKDVAEDISMDISTVSRTVRGKYVQTEFGIYELKYFFSNYLKTDEGDDVSTKEIKTKLKEIIENENPYKPFNDDDLTRELNKLGFKIARRTVAKYREAMKIPKARLRRKLK